MSVDYGISSVRAVYALRRQGIPIKSYSSLGIMSALRAIHSSSNQMRVEMLEYFNGKVLFGGPLLSPVGKI